MLFPYIGITDFMNFEQVLRMSEVFKKHLPQGSKRALHIGVMMSHKTLYSIETDWSQIFPKKETVADIFGSHEAYNCLHYVDYDSDPDLGNSLAYALSWGGSGINAVQLDTIWSDPGQIARGVHSSRKHVEVILQVGKNAIEEANDDPHNVVRRLEDYKGIIHRVLLDKSMGRGLGMNADALLPFVRAIKDSFPDLGITVAGGLGPNSINLVEPLIAEFPDLSIDAQGKLRPSGNIIDPIDWDMAGEYLVKALGLLK